MHKIRPFQMDASWTIHHWPNQRVLVVEAGWLACISHHPTVEAHDTTAMTSLRLLAVLNVRFKYACARQAARASS